MLEDVEGPPVAYVRPLHRPLRRRKAEGEITAGFANTSSLDDLKSLVTEGLHPIVAADAVMLGEGATDIGGGSGLEGGLKFVGDGGGVPKSAGSISGKLLSQ